MESLGKIDSVSSFLNLIEQIYEDKEDDDIFFFRGHFNSSYVPIPSIYRENKGKYQKNILKEDLLFKELMRICSADFSSCKSTFEELVKMQHYDLPTRLLDITENPLVALFFACKNIEGKSTEGTGEVLVFRVNKEDIKCFESDSVSIVSNLAKRPHGFSIPKKDIFQDFLNKVQSFIRLQLNSSRNIYDINLKHPFKNNGFHEKFENFYNTTIKDYNLDNEKDITSHNKEQESNQLRYSDEEEDIKLFNCQPEIQYLLHDVKREKPHFLNLIVPSDLEKVFCVKPKLDNPRIIRQSGAFFLFGIKENKLEHAEIKDELFGKIEIEQLQKDGILSSLEKIGITEASLFPEIDKVARYLSNSLDSL